MSYKRLFIHQGILKSVLKLTVDSVVSLDCLVQCNVIKNVINKFMKWTISSFSLIEKKPGELGQSNDEKALVIFHWIQLHDCGYQVDLSSMKNHFLPLNRKRSCLRGWSRGVHLHYPTSTKFLVIKPIYTGWLTGLYDHLRSSGL